MPETGSQQRIFTWVDSRNQPCPVEIAVDWLCSSTHRPGNSRVGLINKTPPQSFLIFSSSEDLINTFMKINKRLTKIVFDIIKTINAHCYCSIHRTNCSRPENHKRPAPQKPVGLNEIKIMQKDFNELGKRHFYLVTSLALFFLYQTIRRGI